MTYRFESLLTALFCTVISPLACAAPQGLPPGIVGEVPTTLSLPDGAYTLVRTFATPDAAPGGAGRPVSDPEAEHGSAWEAKTFHALPNSVFPTGSRLDLAEGDYVAFFRLKAQEPAGGHKLASLEVLGTGNSYPLAVREVGDRDLKVGRFVRVPVPFHTPGSSVELRVRWTGYATLRLDDIALYKRDGGEATPSPRRVTAAVLSGQPRELSSGPGTSPGPAPLPRSRPPAPEAVVVDIERLPPDWQWVALSLQGLANRKHPTVYCVQGPNDLFWLRHMRERGWIRSWKTSSGPRELLRRYRPLVRGVVVNDPDLPATLNVAGTLAGVENAIVASPRIAKELGLPVLHDLRGRWKTSAEAYEWAFERLWPRLSHSVVSISHPTHTMPRDYLIQNRVFTFWISGPVDGAEPYADPTAEARLMERLLARMPANIPVLGYPYAGEGVGIQENPGVSLLSRYGKYLIPTDFSPNLSFFSGVRLKSLRQPAPPKPKLQDKIYLSFIISDGDNLQVHSRSSFMDLWKSPRRGKVPIGWTISPSADALIPPVVDWYYRNATPNDAFVGAVSGIGYMYPDEYAERYAPGDRQRVFDGFLSQTAAGMEAMDLSTLWIMRGTTPDTHARYARGIPRLAALFPDYGRQVTTYADATFPTVKNVPVFRATTSWAGDTPEQRAAEAARQIRDMAPAEGPAFLHVFILNWTADIPALEAVLRNLGPRYVAVRPDHLGALYREWLEFRRILVRLPERVSALEGQSLTVPVTLQNITSQPMDATLAIGLGDTGMAIPARIRLAPGEPVHLSATGEPRVRVITVTVTEPKGRHTATTAVNVLREADLLGGKPSESLRFFRHFEAEDMSHGFGEQIADAVASSGSAWSSGPPDPRRTGGHIVFGPYESLPEGRYVAVFRLKRLGAGRGDVATVDITVSGGRDPLAARRLTAEDLPEGRYRSVLLPFDYITGDLETRVGLAGSAPLAVDDITIFRVASE